MTDPTKLAYAELRELRKAEGRCIQCASPLSPDSICHCARCLAASQMRQNVAQPDAQRRKFWLALDWGLTNAQLADFTGRPVNTINKWRRVLGRGLRKERKRKENL